MLFQIRAGRFNDPVSRRFLVALILELIQQFRNFGACSVELHMTGFVVADRSAAGGVEVQRNPGPETAFDLLRVNSDQKTASSELEGSVAHGLHFPQSMKFKLDPKRPSVLISALRKRLDCAGGSSPIRRSTTATG